MSRVLLLLLTLLLGYRRDQAHQGSSVDASKDYTLHVFDIKEKSDGNDQESDGCVQLERHERGKANLAWSKAAETSSAAFDPSDVEFTPTTISEGVGASEAPLEWGIQLTGISRRNLPVLVFDALADTVLHSSDPRAQRASGH